MPADRLAAVAFRILAAQPEPPRHVRLSDMWAVNWPLGLYIVIPGAIVNLVVTIAPHLPAWIRVLLVALPLLSLGIWTALVIAPQVRGLRRGVVDLGTVSEIMVQPTGGCRGAVKLEHITSAEPATFYLLTAHEVKPGDRLRVLVDRGTGRVLTTLGVIAT